MFQVFQLDVSKQLQAYEVEYHVLQEEMLATPNHRGDHSGVHVAMEKLEAANQKLKSQNLELLEQLQTARSISHSFELQLHKLQTNQNKLHSHVRTLELERAALLNAVARLRRLIPEDVFEASDVSIPAFQQQTSVPGSPIHNPLVSRFLEEMDVQFSSNSLTDVDKEVAALMATRRKSDQPCGGMHSDTNTTGNKTNIKVKISSQNDQDGEFLCVTEHRDRPASSNR